MRVQRTASRRERDRKMAGEEGERRSRRRGYAKEEDHGVEDDGERAISAGFVPVAR